ncbi:putative naringenin 3-dioxygenase protein [Eutypa lata UCREL1]|uniref:Putative naringenin 3-dioxygenase protein n=1 Tax=Eutypa lata (strain UCR-EL1) TaxID=1287681 RepID=M7SMK6_EUTLA|nr:putative naringenin 3-dioxygenase protein [Eutypa lata UCREL1]
MSFTEIPILDLSLAENPETKPQFLSDLRHALMEVGFMYIKNVGIPDALFEQVVSEGKAFFDIPLEEKLKIEMKNAPSFLGYSRLSAEITAGATDHREQIDLSTEHAVPAPSAPAYHNLLAPNQWPSPTTAGLPNFRPVYTDYMERMGAISLRFTSLIAEAVGLPSDAFDRYFDAPRQQHKLKIVRYPDVAELGQKQGQDGNSSGSNQGVGPHKDSMLTSYLLQASHHRGLQAQNLRGQWIDCPPLPGTLVVAIGQGLEALTQGACRSTTHRVLSPAAGEGARFSIPFFQGVRGSATFEELETVGVGRVPDDVLEQRRRIDEEARKAGAVVDDVEFTFRSGGANGGAKTLGEATLRNRVKSHQDVGERWYPEILKDVREQLARERREKEQKKALLQGSGGGGGGDRRNSADSSSKPVDVSRPAQTVQAH